MTSLRWAFFALFAQSSLTFSAIGAECPNIPVPATATQVDTVCHERYFSLVDRHYLIPRVVGYDLTRDQALGCEPRERSFHVEDQLPKSERVSASDYARSGYDMGHMMPAEDASSLPRTMRDSFSTPAIISAFANLPTALPSAGSYTEHIETQGDCPMRHICTAECGFVTDTRDDLIEGCCPVCGEEVISETGEVEVHTVNVGYSEYNVNVVVVKSIPGTSIKEICDLAVRRADGDLSQGWGKTDDISNSFVDLIARGEFKCAYAAPDADTVPVPLPHTESFVISDPENRAKLKHFDEALDRLNDLLKGDDGQACDEARKFLERVRLSMAGKDEVDPGQAEEELAMCPVCGSFGPEFDGCANHTVANCAASS
ncbi:DNA/RNA non-specific endonuclease [Magnetospirillum molischianum]|uniref:DNA/RNA non-specific endonuclease/pyrophosphatase/phosphodiesterase domain-containing protein n=1 Tax=Magnetospirillum molischianum DSM 120 TaxID=1150626 RepID=H8FXY3_MAGML|nr:DNA/RNA non-specific endonuclease [Magnetospirillum molischianum]CCG43221.1 exported hypothetical protein [Magnetospirillum molischianum DSM 120]